MRRAVPLLAALTLAGCGGHGTYSSSGATTSAGKGKGRAVLTVRWPARSGARLIPNAANSIVVKLTLGTTVVSKTISRPAAGGTTTSTTLTGLAYGTYAVAVGGFPNADGSGVSQAAGAGAMAVTEDVPGSLSVAMASTVANLSISPAAPFLGTGDSATLTASATDATGAIVLLAAGAGAEALTWTSDAPAVVTIAGTGPTARVSALAQGAAGVTASLVVDDAGDVVRSAPAAVVVAPSLTLSPNDAATIDDYTTNSPMHPGSGTSVTRAGLQDGLETTNPSPGVAVAHIYRWEALFSLAGIPAGATIRSATITTSNTYSPTAGFHSVAAYASTNGTVQTNSTATTNLGTLSVQPGAKTVDATATIRSYCAAGSPYAGIRVSFSDVVRVTSWTAPTLRVVYTLP